MEKLISHFAVQFPVSDPELAAIWYQENLGFEITFRWGDPVDYVVTNREEAVSIHFIKRSNEMHNPQAIYIFCYDVDAVYKEFLSKRMSHLTEPQTHEYGMRDFEVKDPDGNRLVFGMGIS